jgi:polyisoprenoid-binding protein YceI
MKLLIISMMMLIIADGATAQTKLFTKSGNISFHSSAILEKIDATNNKALSVWTPADGKIEFSILIKGFKFEKALMQEHFNDDYMESDKFPKATFRGIIENSKSISLTTDNTYNLKVSGTLTMHGVTKPINTVTVIKVNAGVISATAHFTLLLSDYNIKIPSIVADNVSNQILVVITIPAYQQMN